MDKIEFSCPHCKKVTRVPSSYAGKKGKCPGCKRVVKIVESFSVESDETTDLSVAPEPADVRRDVESKSCEFCGETIKRVAKKCRYCGEFQRAPGGRKKRRGRGGRGGRARGPKPNNGLVLGILATLFCCLPIGIVSIVYASQVDSKWAAGDYRGARAAASSANTWAMWSIGLTLVLYVLAVGISLLGV